MISRSIERAAARRAALLAALCGALGAAACGGGESRPGTLVGDAYIVLETGQEVSLAGMRVGLVPESETLDSLISQACPRREGAGAPDSAAQERAWAERARILSAQASRTTSTDVAARYAIDSVAPGEYRIWADTAYGGTRWTWLAPVTVEAGDTARVALSNANPDENPFRCRG
jgi:hypothetical protein